MFMAILTSVFAGALALVHQHHVMLCSTFIEKKFVLCRSVVNANIQQLV